MCVFRSKETEHPDLRDGTCTQLYNIEKKVREGRSCEKSWEMSRERLICRLICDLYFRASHQDPRERSSIIIWHCINIQTKKWAPRHVKMFISTCHKLIYREIFFFFLRHRSSSVVFSTCNMSARGRGPLCDWMGNCKEENHFPSSVWKII